MSYGTYCRLDVHVHDSGITVIRRARLKLKPSYRKGREHRAARLAFYEAMLKCHRDANRLVRDWRLL